jgi:hypothetical protein
VPLRWHVKRKSLSPETIKWGLYSIAVCAEELGTKEKVDANNMPANYQVHQR